MDVLPLIGEHPELEILDAHGNYFSEAPSGTFDGCLALKTMTLLPAAEKPATPPPPTSSVSPESVGLDLGQVVSGAVDAVVELTARAIEGMTGAAPSAAPEAAVAAPTEPMIEEEAAPATVAPTPSPAAAAPAPPPSPPPIKKAVSFAVVDQPAPKEGGCCIVA